MKYEYDIRNPLRTTKLKNRTDRISRYCFSETLDLTSCQVAIFSSIFENPFGIVKENSASKLHKKDKKSFLKIFTNNHFQAKSYDRSFNYDQFYKFPSLL